MNRKNWGHLPYPIPEALRTHVLRLLGPRAILNVGLLGYLEPSGMIMPPWNMDHDPRAPCSCIVDTWAFK